MDAINLIVGALAGGISCAASDIVSAEITQAYQRLRTQVVDYWQQYGPAATPEINQAKAEHALEELGEEPEAYAPLLAKKLQQIMPEPPQDILKQARVLEDLLKNTGQQVERYKVIIKNAENVIVGHHNSQTITKHGK